jgi:hypothetical protein
MEDDSRPGEAEEGQRCSWCGVKLREDEVREGVRQVCRRCVRRLMDAGLSDEEIFGGGPVGRE